MLRNILHADINSCYAAIEIMCDPSLKNYPVAVHGPIADRHGMVLAKSILAKKYGIKTGDTVYEAKIKCKDIVLREADFHKYEYVTGEVKGIFDDYTDQREDFGVDEAWLDCTKSRQIYGSAEEIAQIIRKRVKEELGLTLSIGVSWNKIYSKLASDLAGPDSILVIDKNNYRDIVFPRPVDELLYVGRARSKSLREIGLSTIGALATTDVQILRQRLKKFGEILHIFANGWDTTPVLTKDEIPPARSIGNSITAYRDLLDDEDAKMTFDMLAESVGERMRDLGLKCKGVEIQLRDKLFYSRIRQCRLERPTQTYSDLVQAGMKLLKENHDWRVPLRSIGIRAIDMVMETSNIQLSMFQEDEEKIQKREKLEHVKDELRHRFGHNIIFPASFLKDRRLTGANPKANHTIHPLSFFR